MVGNQRQWQWSLLSWQPLGSNWSITHREVISCLALWFLWNSDIEDNLSSMKPLPTSDGIVPVHTGTCEHRLISEQHFNYSIEEALTLRRVHTKLSFFEIHRRNGYDYFRHRKYSSPFIYLFFFHFLFCTWPSEKLIRNECQPHY